jgi:hypothetical protein
MEANDDPFVFAIVAALAGVFVGLQPVQAYQAPWCAVIENGVGSVYWDCQYHSFEDCYRSGNILGGNRGFCNPSPYYVPNATEHTRSAKPPRSPAVAAQRDMSLINLIALQKSLEDSDENNRDRYYGHCARTCTDAG